MTHLTSSTLTTRNPNLVVANIDGDMVMMSIEQGENFGITGVGSRVWELLAAPTTVADIVRVIYADAKSSASSANPVSPNSGSSRSGCSSA